MKPSDLWQPQCLFIDIGQSSLKVLQGDRGLDLPIERLDNGRLSNACKENLASSLGRFLDQKIWRFRQHAYCAVSARGVSLRHLALPAASDDALRQVLALQLESEFPLPPEALAWGYYPLAPRNGPPAGATPGRELIVAALKREGIEEYRECLSKCGLIPIFTLGALARTALCPPRPEEYALLDLGRHHSELASVEHGRVTAARVIPWGGDDLTRALGKRLGIDREQAEKLKASSGDRSGATREQQGQIQACIQEAAASLAGLLRPGPTGQKLYLTGETSRADAFPQALAQALDSSLDVQRIEFPPGAGRSAATLGLKRLVERNGSTLPLTFQVREEKARDTLPPPVRWHWAALACLLLVTLLTLRYAEAFLSKGRLSRRLAEINSYRDGLPRIDHELAFLQYLETNEPPFLDTLFVLANAAPGGTRFDSVSMNRRGEVALRGVMPNAQQTTDFRSKLIDSGFFATVVLDEQAPSPDRQRVLFRMSAQWKPNGQRPRVSPEPSAKEASKPGAPPASAEALRPPKASPH